MSALEQIVLWWFLNAAWELPVCFVCCLLILRFLRNLAASLRHGLWLAALTLGFLAPFGTVLGLWGNPKTLSSDLGLAVAARVNGSSGAPLVLLIFAAPALYRAFLLLRGGIAASRLTCRATPVDPGTLESVLPTALLLSIKRHKARVFSTSPTAPECGPFYVRGEASFHPHSRKSIRLAQPRDTSLRSGARTCPRTASRYAIAPLVRNHAGPACLPPRFLLAAKPNRRSKRDGL